MSFRKFDYSSLEELKQEVGQRALGLPFSDNLEILSRKVSIESRSIPNSLAIHPVEGNDACMDGSPDELTFRRYKRFSRSGAGLVTTESVAVVKEGRASPKQLMIHSSNLKEYKRISDSMMANAKEEFGSGFEPLYLMQLTHSGRFCKPEGKPAPVIAVYNPILDPRLNINENYPVIEDDELERLEDQFVEAAILAREAGFHGVDVKCCHRYLINDLLSAYTRSGKYGGSFEGRTRFLLNVIGKIKSRLGNGFVVTTRLNIYDGIQYPYGWGVNRDDHLQYDLEEPKKLVRILYDLGVRLINLSMGSASFISHISRPSDKDFQIPPEHPLVGVSRFVSATGAIQKEVPGMAVVGTGYSWLRHFSPYLAAGVLEHGLATMIGYGREAITYPDFVRDILERGALKKEKCCITCSKCIEIMKAGGPTGCVIRDPEVYAPIYRQYCMK